MLLLTLLPNESNEYILPARPRILRPQYLLLLPHAHILTNFHITKFRIPKMAIKPIGSPLEAKSDADLLVFGDESSWTETSKSGGEPTPGSEDFGPSVTIAVVFPFSDNGGKPSHNTVPVTVSLTSPPTYEELEDKIVAASEGPLSCLHETSDELRQAVGRFKSSIKGGKGVYFVWDFATRSHPTGTSAYTMPGYGTSQASRLTRDDFVECLHAADAGRISHIMVDAEFLQDKATSVSSEKLNQSQPQNDQTNGDAAKVPVAHGSNPNIPVTAVNSKTPSQSQQQNKITGVSLGMLEGAQQQNKNGNGNAAKVPVAHGSNPNIPGPNISSKTSGPSQQQNKATGVTSATLDRVQQQNKQGNGDAAKVPTARVSTPGTVSKKDHDKAVLDMETDAWSRGIFSGLGIACCMVIIMN
ncbi:hypothetical protein F4802DRAFT_18937 [Xylaria palmicola]|nr:hypothetical protein F4802DRAFT_18937 [Xylaria palmicola]